MRPAPAESPWPASCAAAILPLVLYVCTASAHGYWLDSGEFTAAAVWLDIAHPPGHPLASLWGKLFCLLPVGPLPFRVAVGQAVAAALALALLQRALYRSLAHLGMARAWAGGALSVGACWLLGSAYGFWFQAVRAEVYALQALLVCIALERLSVLACRAAPRDPHPLYLACAALGLGLANHHFIAVLALPALGLAAVQLTRARGVRVLGVSLVAGCLGLACYAYLPLRAAREPPMDLGHPVSLRDVLWVMSARVYARGIGSDAPQPLGERMLDLLVLLDENLGMVTLLLAVLGAYVLMRAPRGRALGFVWIVSAVVSLCGRAWLNAVRANPDVLGYLLPGFASVVALAVIGVSALCASAPMRLRGAASLGAVLGLAALLMTRFAPQHARATLADFQATDPIDALRRRDLPVRSLLVLTTPDAVFRHWEGEATDGLREDVLLLPLPFVGYGAVHEVWLRRHPQLAPLIDAFRAEGTLSAARLVQLASTRPIYVELDLRTSLALYAHVVPEGLLYRVLPHRPSREAVSRACASQRDVMRELSARIGADVTEVETRKQLLMMHYVRALYATSHGDLAAALAATRAGLSMAPHTRELRMLAGMLTAPRVPSLDRILIALGHGRAGAI